MYSSKVNKSCLAALLFYFLLVQATCKKQDSPPVEEPITSFVQKLSADVAGNAVVLTNSINQNREILRGSLTTVGYSNGQTRQMYNIEAAIPALNSFINVPATLKIQLENIKQGTFAISGSASVYQPLEGSFAVLSIRNATGSGAATLYTASVLKQPFNVQVTGFERHADSSLPTVTGTFTGVLYNTQNINDSVIVKNGTFRVRF